MVSGSGIQRRWVVAGRRQCPLSSYFYIVWSDNLLQFKVRQEMWSNSSLLLAASRSTECQQEAAGLKQVQVPGYHPVCDDRGFYKPQQCFKGSCWCVNPANGQEIPNSIRNGPASCGAAVQSASGEMRWLVMSSDLEYFNGHHKSPLKKEKNIYIVCMFLVYLCSSLIHFWIHCQQSWEPD